MVRLVHRCNTRRFQSPLNSAILQNAILPIAFQSPISAMLQNAMLLLTATREFLNTILLLAAKRDFSY
jgi:hypothetical protein